MQERHKELIQKALEILKDLGLGEDYRLESIMPIHTEEVADGYDVGISCRIGEPNLFGDEHRETYIVEFDECTDEMFKMWRKE